jgi:dihydropteroate synthase
VSGGSASLAERLPQDLPASARLYLRPIGLVSGPAASLIAAGTGRSVAGGPLAFTGCEVCIRASGRTSRIGATLADLERWAARCGGVAEARVTSLLTRITEPRAAPDGRDPSRPRLMGILNVTPDSFSDGGDFTNPAAAVAQGICLVEAGADILDIGGESTRPGAEPVAPQEEIARVLPVIEGLVAKRDALRGARISIDTRRAAVMRAALAAGADIINDVTALTGDPESMAVAAESRAMIMLMHMQGEPRTMNIAPSYDDVVLDVFDALEARLEACIAAGIDRRRLVADPGLGFGKRGRENVAILRALALYHGLGVPLLLGASRKGLGDAVSGRVTPKQRLPSSLGAAMHGLSQGVQILRVHDVAETHQVLRLWERLHGFEE